MASEDSVRRVDHSAIKVNQAFIVGLLALAFVTDSLALAAIVSAAMLLGTMAPRLAPFQAVYRYVLRPAGIVEPRLVVDNPEPHLFAQGFGGAVVALGLLALLGGAPILGWALVLLVAALASINLFVGFCAGCFLYYQLNRLGVPGFRHSPVRRS